MATLMKPSKEKSKKTSTKERLKLNSQSADKVKPSCSKVEDTKTENEDEDGNIGEGIKIRHSTNCDDNVKAIVNATIAARLDGDKEEYLSIQESESWSSVPESLHGELAAASCPSLPEVEKSESVQAVTTTMTQPSAPTAPLNMGMPTIPAVDVWTRGHRLYPNIVNLQAIETNVRCQSMNVEMTNCSTARRRVIAAYTDQELDEIYSCSDLKSIDQSEQEFLTGSQPDMYVNEMLHVLLTKYYDSQSKLTTNCHDMSKHNEDIVELQEKAWTMIPVTKTFYGHCDDRHQLKESVTYKVAMKDDKVVNDITMALDQLFQIFSHDYIENTTAAMISKCKIQKLIDDIISHSTSIRMRASSILSGPYEDTAGVLPNLRRAIAILFAFVRKPSPSKVFDSDVKQWLSQLVSVLVRFAIKEDHWFVLFNILRCPRGIGKWAANFVQIPLPSTGGQPPAMESQEISHCLAVLRILLLPIKRRDDYLKAFAQELSNPATAKESWIVLDSDGEESTTASGDCVGLRESDLIALLNQIPFDTLFSSALNVITMSTERVLDVHLISPQRMLKVIAFFTKLITIFGDGMLTYNTERYKQLAKRLGHLVRHTLRYTFDYYELFMCNNFLKDARLCERITVELNALLIKSCAYIHRTRNLATWQYFTSLPFGILDAATIWQLFYHLNIGFNVEPTSDEEGSDYVALYRCVHFWTKFNVANVDSSAEDLYYLLQTFFEMANERDKHRDWDLITTIALHIFNIGYINGNTRDVCYKAARDMLVNLCQTHEELMAYLLRQLKSHIGDVDNALYFFKSLPLDIWRPPMDCFEIASNWLLHCDYKRPENMIARILFGRLNWGLDGEGRLFLSDDLHMRMCGLLCASMDKHSAELNGTRSLTDSVRQVSNLMDFSKSTGEEFANWCWTMIFVLRLHVMDQSVESIRIHLRNPPELLPCTTYNELLDNINRGTVMNQPFAAFASILVTPYGQSVSAIRQKGFDHVRLLVNDHRYAAAIRCIELIMPLFMDMPETLTNCESFQIVLNLLLNADKTYLKMAKDMIYTNPLGPIVTMLDNMIHHQINSYRDYGLITPLKLINIWLHCLTKATNWHNTCAVHLVNALVGVAYQFPDARLHTTDFFRNQFKNCIEWKINRTSTLRNFFNGTQTRIPSPSPSYSWLSLVLLEIEYQTQDEHFWPELLHQLALAPPECNLENVLNRTTNVKRIASMSAQTLVIYKYAHLLSTMDVQHAIFLIVGQKFFELFLSRVPTHYEDESIGGTFGVADKFYEYDVPLMKKVKAKLIEAETYYAANMSQYDDNSELHYFRTRCFNMIKTFQLWLEETAINKIAKDQHIMVSHYNPEKLSELLRGNTSHWTEFVYLPRLQRAHKEQSEQWANKCFRQKSNRKQHHSPPPRTKQKLELPQQRIFQTLSSYDKRIELTTCERRGDVARPRQIIIDKRTQQLLFDGIKVIGEGVRKLFVVSSKLKLLNTNYLSALSNLYRMEASTYDRRVSCSMLGGCSGPARITVKREEIKMTTHLLEFTKECIANRTKLIDNVPMFHVTDLVKNMQEVQEIVTCLCREMETTTNNGELVTKIAIDFYYHIVDFMNPTVLNFVPSKVFCVRLLQELNVFLLRQQSQECYRILSVALKRPDLLNVLVVAYEPHSLPLLNFQKLYDILIATPSREHVIPVLCTFLSKIDMSVFLRNCNHLDQTVIRSIVDLVMRGLKDITMLQDIPLRHLLQIYQFRFPTFHLVVVSALLAAPSPSAEMSRLILMLMNSLLKNCGCKLATIEDSTEQMSEIAESYARRQNCFDLNLTENTIKLLTDFFQQMRLKEGNNGLYAAYGGDGDGDGDGGAGDCCRALSYWFLCFGDVLIVTTICTHNDLLADRISEIIFGRIMTLYAPWLVAYTPAQFSADGSRAATEGKLKLPWSEMHKDAAKMMTQSMINTILYLLDSLPVASHVLAMVFAWYIHHYAVPDMQSHVHAPIHEAIARLPWEQFQPAPNSIDFLHGALQIFFPESHAMLGHIFIRIDWNAWFEDVLPAWPPTVQVSVVSRLLTVFVKIAFEPNTHVHALTSRLLNDAVNYPWHLVEYNELEDLFKWFASTVGPLICLQLPNEINYTDRGVMHLLRVASGLTATSSSVVHDRSETAKRILYTRSSIRILRACANKNQKLLATKDGRNAYHGAFIELLQTLTECLTMMAANRTPDERQRQALNVAIEIVTPMGTQSEESSNLQIDAYVQWLQQRPVGNLLAYNMLAALGHMKTTLLVGCYRMLEQGIVYYFKKPTEEANVGHNPSWQGLLNILSMVETKLDLIPILRESHLLTLHVFILFKVDKLATVDEEIILIQDICQLIEGLKTSEAIEPQMAIIWGVLISRGCRALLRSENARKPLLMLARHLYVLSTRSDGWGDGLLGAIGLKRDATASKRKVLTRCLSCIIFSLFPDTSAGKPMPNQEYLSAMNELHLLLSNKKFVPLNAVIATVIAALNENRLPELCDVPHLVARIISVFYDNNFLTTVAHVWNINFKG